MKTGWSPPLILIKHSSHAPAAPVNAEDEFSASWASPRNRKMADWAAIVGEGIFQGLKIRFKLLCPLVWAQMAFVAQAVHLLGQPSIFRNKFTVVSKEFEEADQFLASPGCLKVPDIFHIFVRWLDIPT